MLNITKKSVVLTGFSAIDGTNAEGYQATINMDNPKDMSISGWQVNKELYKENRTQCRADREVFEEAAYALQEELIEKNKEADAEQ